MTGIQSDISTLPILQEPAVIFKVYLQTIESTCLIKFQDGEHYGLPYIQSIPKHSPTGQQLA